MMCWIETLGRDLLHGVRLFCRQPFLTSLAVLTLSLGIGANTATFSMLNAALLSPLPFPDAGRLVAVVDGFRTTGVTGVGPTVPELIDVRKSSRNLDGLSFYDTRDFQLNGGDEPVRVFAARIEASFLTLLGVHPSYGRLFQDGENLPGRDRVILLTDGIWRRNFGDDPAIVGRQIIVNGSSSTVVGVLPPEFSFGLLQALWLTKGAARQPRGPHSPDTGWPHGYRLLGAGVHGLRRARGNNSLRPRAGSSVLPPQLFPHDGARFGPGALAFPPHAHLF